MTVRCLCGGPVRVDDWNGDDRRQLSIIECLTCGVRMALHIKLEVIGSAKAVDKDPLPVDDLRHGTQNGYGNYGCRCDRCRDAHTRWRRGLRHAGSDAAS